MESGVPSEPRAHERTALVLLAALTILALLLRFWELGTWNFQATEVFTWRDSGIPQFRNPRPLGYLLNYFVVRPFIPLDEFGLRVIPAIAGVLTIPAMYLVSRSLIGWRGALMATLLLTVNPLHILYSQLARYWSLVFLLCTIYPYALYLGIRRRSAGLVILGLVMCGLGMLAHPVSVLLLGGLGIWAAVTYLKGVDLVQSWRQAWARPGFRWGLLAGAIVSALVLARLIRLLQGWISEHHGHVGGQFLSRPTPQGLKQIVFLAAFTEQLLLPLVIVGVAGIYLLWRERDRSLAVLLTSLAAFPLVFIPLLSLRTPVSTYYVLPTAPVFFIGAGAFFDRLFRVEWRPLPRWVVPTTVAALIVLAGLPTLISDYRDGRRYDFRGVARWMATEISPGDTVFSDQPVVMKHYLPEVAVQHLRQDTAGFRQWLDRHQPGTPGTLWVVAPTPSHAFRSNLKKGGLIDWLHHNCQLSYSRGVGRMDLRQNYLDVYRCPPAPETSSRSDVSLR
jgi:mannosyltransferase